MGTPWGESGAAGGGGDFPRGTGGGRRDDYFQIGRHDGAAGAGKRRKMGSSVCDNRSLAGLRDRIGLLGRRLDPFLYPVLATLCRRNLGGIF